MPIRRYSPRCLGEGLRWGKAIEVGRGSAPHTNVARSPHGGKRGGVPPARKLASFGGARGDASDNRSRRRRLAMTFEEELGAAGREEENRKTGRYRCDRCGAVEVLVTHGE